MLKANFKITETGGTGVVQLQVLVNSTIGWANVGQTLTLVDGQLTVDDNTGIELDPAQYEAGRSYLFRLADAAGTPVSNMVSYEIPDTSGNSNSGQIVRYVAVKSNIDFVPQSGDNWTVNFVGSPVNFKTSPDTTLAGYQAAISFYHAGIRTMLLDDNHDNLTRTSDYTTTVGGNGAGVYELFCMYLTQDGRSTAVQHLIKVDDSGNVLISVESNGCNVNYALDTTFSADALTYQNGSQCPVDWKTESSDGVIADLGTGTVQTVTPPVGNKKILFQPIPDSSIWDDYNGKIGAYIQLSPA